MYVFSSIRLLPDDGPALGGVRGLAHDQGMPLMALRNKDVQILRST